MRAFVSQRFEEGAIPETELARTTGWIATGQQWSGPQSSGSSRCHGSAPRRERTRCDNNLPDPHPDGSSLDEDCDGVSLPVQQIRSTGPLRRAIGQRRRPARSPARSPPLSTISESHEPNACTPSITDGAKLSPSNLPGLISINQSITDTVHLPIGGRSRGICSPCTFRAWDRGEDKQAVVGVCSSVCFPV